MKTGQSEGTLRSDKSCVEGAAASAISRRDLLQGAASTSILLSPAAALAATPNSYDLSLNLSQDERFLTVIEKPVYKQDDTAAVLAKWRVHAVLFGPKAWFDLVKPQSANEFTLKVFDARFGDRDDVEFTFSFTRKKEKDPWSIDLSTSLWRWSGGGGNADATAVEFNRFVAAAAPAKLVCKVASSNVDGTLRRVFRDHVRVAGGAPSHFNAGFDSGLLWSLAAISSSGPVNTRIFAVLDAQAFLEKFEFGWQADQFDATHEKIIGEVTLSGGGTTPLAGIDKQTLTIGNGHHAAVTLANDGGARNFDVRIGVSPLDPSLDQVVSRLQVGAGSVALKDVKATMAGSVTSSDLVLSQTVLPTTKTRRTTLWGSAGKAPDSKTGKVISEEIATPIGRLAVGAFPPDEAAASSDKKDAAPGHPAHTPTQPTSAPDPLAKKKERELFFRASCGDRAGARQATAWIVDDVRHGQAPTTPRRLRRVAFDLALLKADVAPEDVSFSSLVFRDNGSDLRLIFEDGDLLSELKPSGEFPRVKPSSFVWVGPLDEPSRHRADIDLSRATLTVARDYDLMKLRFRFLDFVLAFTPAPVIRPARADCRLIRSDDGKYIDSRPVLVAEFDPQHVFEEALFRPEPPDLPDVEIKHGDDQVTREEILAELVRLKNDHDGLNTYRKGIRKDKYEAEQARIDKEKEKFVRENPGVTFPGATPVFRTFAEKYEEKATSANLPDDLRIYLGPYGLDADAMHLARSVFKNDLQAAVEAVVRQTFARVQSEVIPSLKAAGHLKDSTSDNSADDKRVGESFENALRNERSFEEVEPVYAAFRSFYREQRLAAEQRGPPANPQPPEVTNRLLWRTEFLSEGNRPKVPNGSTKYPTPTEREQWFSDILLGKDDLHGFIDQVRGADPIADLMSGRLSGPSRLAFHVNCMPPSNATSQEAGLHQSSGAKPWTPSGGGFAYDPMPFTFEALTDWSRHEPAVTLRARKLFSALPSGIVPPLGERAANLSDHEVLGFQGISKGFVTAEQRLGEIRASMARKPTFYETAVEIPSRLILSTAQDAVWQTVRRLPAADNLNAGAVAEKLPSPVLEAGRSKQPTDKPLHGALWSARLAVEDINPSLRIIDSPDFRPMVLAPAKQAGNPPMPGRGAPPRGPLAPWFIGAEQMESTTVTAEDVNARLPKESSGRLKDDSCPPFGPDGPTFSEKIFQVLKWLCGRADVRKGTPVSWQMFRTTLDAYDRHQLVMLSSAYGLPVIGRRQAAGSDVETVGPLIADSGQFEPGNPGEYALSDARNDQAIYRPIALSVRELTLTALGGSFNHDTAFQPSAGADDLWGRKLFEGFSIERWQQNIVLGRDVLGQVVYKGYLFPFGHRASMIKQTERIFLRTPHEGVKAMLRQRIFLHVAQPLQRFPALGQPHRGAMWCGESVTLRTIWTPDILDPTAAPIVKGGESLNGRIDLGAGNPGLAFFPRTDITERGLVSFELLVDGAPTRFPLIFVDNIASTTASSLGNLIKFYNSTDKKWVSSRRTLPMNGQKIRFAPENRSGDTVLTTESIQVAAHGRVKDFGGGWAGDLSTYNTTGTLEGAQQPPFYPAMDKAVVRLEQVERFSGGQRKPVAVQYDGHYVRHGFATEKNPDGELKWNPLEVFLNLRNIITSGMGDNGARGGAIGRPASNIVAVSRSKGPLGGDRYLKYETLGYDDPTQSAADAQTRLVSIATVPEDTPIFTEAASWDKIWSLATYFDHQHELTAPGLLKVDPQPPGPVDVVPRQDDNSRKDNVLKTLQILQSYFSGEAKLLGTVKIKYLLALLDLDDLLSAVPVLRETLEYGTAAANGIADLATDVRTRVIFPLAEVINRLRTQWDALDASLKKKLGQQASSFTLAKIFPEIENGLADIEKALRAASNETDPIRLADQLGTVYESGRRFIRVLAAIAANPVERLKDSATRAINDVIEGFSGDFQTLSQFKEQVVAVVNVAQNLNEAQIRKWVADYVSAELTEQLSFSFVRPNLVAVAQGLSSKPVPQSVLDALSDLDQVMPTAKDLADILVPAARAVLLGQKRPEDALKEAFNGWIGAKKNALHEAVLAAKVRIRDAVDIQVEAVRLAATAALEEFEDRIDKWVIDRVLPECIYVLDSVKRVLELYAEVDAIAKAAKAGDVTSVIRAVGTFSSDAFGFNLDAYAVGVTAPYKSKIGAVHARITAFIKPFTVVDDNERDRLAAELAACLRFEDGETGVVLPVASSLADPPLSKTPLNEIAQALKEIQSLKQPLEAFRATLAAQPDPLPPQLNGLVTFHGNLTKLVVDLTDAHKQLYCATVQAWALLNEVKQWLATDAWSMLDQKALEQLTRFNARIDGSIKTIAVKLARIGDIVVKFVNDPQNLQYASSALFIGGANAVLGAGLTGPVSIAAKDLQTKGAAAEAKIAVALATLLKFLLKLTNEGSMFGATLAEDLRKAVSDLSAELAKFDRDLGKASSEVGTSLGDLTEQLKKLAAVDLPDTPSSYTTIKQLREAKLKGLDVAVQQALNGTDFNNRLDEIIATARDTEAKALAAWRKLQQKIAGLPDLARQKLAEAIVASGVFDKMAAGYSKLLDLRKAAIMKIAEVPLLSAQARHVLLVAPAYGTACNIGDTAADPIQLAGCDRLFEEHAVVLTKMTGTIDAAKQNLAVRFFGSWIDGKAAPLVIGTQVRGLAAQVLKGDVLSLIDVSTFRDAIEDAIAGLIPSRATLAFDFSRTVKNPPSKSALFQAQQGSVFEVKVRAVVNLLKPGKIDFRANGALGPFDVKLVGGLIDALTLKFDGAVFEMVDGSAPHFDVAYKDFEIGESLKFAQQLQSFLSPKDGNGVFIQPMTRTAGIEAGYGIDLGSIGCGVTSFFNVTLNVSAELPFTNSESLFKVSLGRRLRPFTISVIPFAGAGYFSIFAAPDGIRGFEASFEFGGGGSIGFGPLQAQVRIMVGVFVRVLRVDNTNSCTIFGTFFAGGSASIWIFSFATSLYVRLGRSDGGDMYGEAIYSFSFSLGIVDYDYSITAFKREKAIGNSSKSSGQMEDEEQFDGRTRLASADDGLVMSDAPPVYAQYVKKPKPKPKPKSEPPKQPRSDVMSEAVGPGTNLHSYLSYFDLGLLDKV